MGIAVDKAGLVYISDSASGLLRVVTSDGVIHSIAGAGADPANAGFAGDGGAAMSAEFNGVNALTVDPTGKIYLIDQQNERVQVTHAVDPLAFSSLTRERVTGRRRRSFPPAPFLFPLDILPVEVLRFT